VQLKATKKKRTNPKYEIRLRGAQEKQ